MPRINVLEWINNHYNLALNNDDFECVKEFTLMWNLFERNTCNAHFNKERIRQLILQNNLAIEDFQEVINYFRNRYITDGNLNETYNRLRLRHTDNPELVRNFLLGNENNVEAVILSCAIIVYRFRNNMFHGEKDLANLHLQTENFHTANFFIAAFLENVHL